MQLDFDDGTLLLRNAPHAEWGMIASTSTAHRPIGIASYYSAGERFDSDVEQTLGVAVASRTSTLGNALGGGRILATRDGCWVAANSSESVSSHATARAASFFTTVFSASCHPQPPSVQHRAPLSLPSSPPHHGHSSRFEPGECLRPEDPIHSRTAHRTLYLKIGFLHHLFQDMNSENYAPAGI